MKTRIKEIKARLAKTIDGPWVKGKWGDGSQDGAGQANIFAPTCEVTIAVDVREEDADFMANAHQDIPWLIAEIERLNECISNSYDSGYHQGKRSTI